LKEKAAAHAHERPRSITIVNEALQNNGQATELD
jgi:hypothetical protein